jgi:hypothetical protein
MWVSGFGCHGWGGFHLTDPIGKIKLVTPLTSVVVRTYCIDYPPSSIFSLSLELERELLLINFSIRLSNIDVFC